MVRESFYQDVLLQWIPQDSDGLLLHRCDATARMCLSAASKALRSSFGHWLVTQYADSISELEECGFLCCKLFLHHGGLDAKITMAKALPGFGGLLWREELSMYPLDIIAAAEKYEVNEVFYRLRSCSAACMVEKTDPCQRSLGRSSFQNFQKPWRHWKLCLLNGKQMLEGITPTGFEEQMSLRLT